jgi:hypothetical protein
MLLCKANLVELFCLYFVGGTKGGYLLHHLDTSVGIIFKEKHYPQRDFLEANMGYMQPNVWRSI